MSFIKLQRNKISNSNKKTMKERLLSSIFIASFFIFLFLFGILSDKTNNWSPITNPIIVTAFGWVLLIYLLPFIFIVAREINNIFFKFNKISYLLILSCSIILIYAPTMVYFLKYYGYISIEIGNRINQLNTVTNIFAIVLGCSILLTVIINTLLLWINHEMTFKNWIILNLIVGVTSGFFLSSLFFLFTRGWLVLLWLMLIVIDCDSFSYFGGLLFGRHKMAPKISPKKTWEGFAIGQIITVGLALLILFSFSYIKHEPDVLKQIMGIQFQHITNSGIQNGSFNHNTVQWWILMTFVTIILSLLSVFGDLSFSWFKRKYRIKDYGYLIPGHGGIIDRIDSHSVVISFYFVLSFVIALFANTIVFFE